MIAAAPKRRMVLEVTEHVEVADYDTLVSGLDALRTSGCRIAVDDAGAGYSSLRHILRLRPDYIKLDMTLTRGIDTDGDRRALASSLLTFAARGLGDGDRRGHRDARPSWTRSAVSAPPSARATSWPAHARRQSSSRSDREGGCHESGRRAPAPDYPKAGRAVAPFW